MLALVLEQFGSLVVQERPIPEPVEGEVLIGVVAAGICGTDIHGFTGENGRRAPGQVMGHESVGRVAALGPGTSGPPVGSAVTFNPVVLPRSRRAEYAGNEQHCPDKYVIGVRPDVPAAFAEYLVVPVENVVRLAETMPIALGALVEPLAVAVHAVSRIGARSGDDVLVLGGGPIGQSVVLALRMAGVTSIVVSEPSAERRELLRSLDARTVDPSAPAGVAEQTAAAFGRPAGLALDAVGLETSLRDALLATRQGASIGLIGMGSQRLAVDAYRVSTEERSIIGSFTYADRDFQRAADWMSGAPEQAQQLISREIGLDEAQDTFRALADGDQPPGKVLIRMDAPTAAKGNS